MKSGGLTRWIAKTYNSFANADTCLQQFRPLKSIGDALMYYIEEPDLIRSGFNTLQIYDGLWQLATERQMEFPDVKVGAAWCEDVYPLTFLKGNQDYYGIDVDLTARLQQAAQTRQVVIDQRFFDKVMQDYNDAGNRDQFDSVRRLKGPEKANFKGIPQVVDIYRASELTDNAETPTVTSSNATTLAGDSGYRSILQFILAFLSGFVLGNAIGSKRSRIRQRRRLD